jgi:hypothetical protein
MLILNGSGNWGNAEKGGGRGPHADLPFVQKVRNSLEIRLGGGRGPVAPPVFKTGLAANTVAGGFDSLPPPPVEFTTFFPMAARLYTEQTRY